MKQGKLSVILLELSYLLFFSIFTGVEGSTQLVVLGNDSNGLIFGYNGATFGVMRRQNGTDYWINQQNWNMDKVDATELVG